MLAMRYRAHELGRPAGPRNGGPQHFALADEIGSKPGGTAAFARGATEDERVSAIFDNGMCVTMTVRAGDLRDRLESKDATAPKFSQAREGIFQTVDLSEGVQFVDD